MKKTITAKNHITTSITTLLGRISRLIPALALLIVACDDPGEIGLELNPENGAFVAQYKELPLSSSIVLVEDIPADNFNRIDQSVQKVISDGRLLVGNYSTPDFGSFSSTGFASLYLRKVGFQPKSEYTFDSLILFMRVDYLYGPSFSGNKQIAIHELKEEIKIDSLYLTKNSTPYHDQPLGVLNYDVSALDSIRVDTTFRVRLSDELGNRFMNEANTDTTTFSSDDEFRKFFYGFAFVPGVSNDMVTGIHVENPSTFVRMYIHKDTLKTSVDFEYNGISNTMVGINNKIITRYYNNIQLDRAGSALSPINEYLTDFVPADGRGQMQASSGVFTKLNFAPFLAFIDTIDNIIINRAELVIPVEPYNNHIDPTSTIDLYRVDQDNHFIDAYDATSGINTYLIAGKFGFEKAKNERAGKYSGVLTPYIQSLASSDLSDSMVLIGAPNLWNSVIANNQATVPLQDIRLRVYYSTLK